MCRTKPYRYPKLPEIFDVHNQVSERGESCDASSSASIDNKTRMLALNITTLNIRSPYPGETYALTADLCDSDSDTSGCTKAKNIALVTSVACDPRKPNNVSPFERSPGFSGTGGFADAPASQTGPWPIRSSFGNTSADPGFTYFSRNSVQSNPTICYLRVCLANS